ncbi:hypothetical protein [Streptomyces sp. ISL-11]|uniref:hypothetical protein n=1 Tax=Streptomyces sp. ISL-11 TaxID=2819174 RepID=UPI001BE70C95|nr:hypothetical protein [Streptomyces sp. ISL-11]MBT2383762.1 hypothetical protein [Streptomyces sp. ISL-11]
MAARVGPAGLVRGAVIAQSLDNQWVNAELTKDMVRKGKSLQDVDGVRGKEVRAEYFRSLINTRQVVANRVFFYNNRAVSCDLVEGGAARRAHQRLLADGALVPFLLNEREPTDPPRGVDVDREAFTAWQDTVEAMPAGSRVTCLRMSWDDQENRDTTRSALFNPFAARVQGLTAKDIPLLAAQVGVPGRQHARFAERIGEVVQLSNERRIRGELVTRGVLYEEFVSVPGLPVSEGRYDKRKPFAGEIKQLLDLIYNVNLADALGMYPLTPAGSLRRLALQEWRDVRTTADGAVTDPEQLMLFLRRQAFSTVQDRLSLTPSTVDTLALADIRSLRESDAWDDYMRAFDALTADPAAFEDRVGLVFDRYVRLNSEIVRLADTRGDRRTGANRWSPVIEVVVAVGGAVFTAVTGDETWSVVGSLGSVSAECGGSVQLVLRNRVEGRREQKFAREMATVRFDSAREWEQFHSMVRKLPGYREQGGPPAAATSSATIQDEIPEY